MTTKASGSPSDIIVFLPSATPVKSWVIKKMCVPRIGLRICQNRIRTPCHLGRKKTQAKRVWRQVGNRPQPQHNAQNNVSAADRKKDQQGQTITLSNVFERLRDDLNTTDGEDGSPQGKEVAKRQLSVFQEQQRREVVDQPLTDSSQDHIDVSIGDSIPEKASPNSYP